MQTFIPWNPWKLSFRYILFHEKKTPNNAVTQHHSQFTPKMKANAVPRLLSSLVWIDSGVVVSQNHLESFLSEIKCNGMTSFMEFMCFQIPPTGITVSLIIQQNTTSSFTVTILKLKQRIIMVQFWENTWLSHQVFCKVLCKFPVVSGKTFKKDYKIWNYSKI